MSSLPERVLATIRAHHMVQPGGRVLVAVSGGSDSVGLLHLLSQLALPDHFIVAGLLHLHHRLRAAGDEDEEFCHRLAAELGLPLVVERVDVRMLAHEWRTSLEDAGRRARYTFFERAAAELGAETVATGHTRDDQAETFLLQLIRGAGPRGLASVSPTRGRICRPLLDVRRSEVREWLAARSLTFREDESNHDPAFTRNRVRHCLIPYLQREFSPAIVDVLAREAGIARADEDRLQSEAIEVARSVVLSEERAGEGQNEGGTSQQVLIDAEALTSLHPAIAARVCRMALRTLAGGRQIGCAHVQRLLALARRPEGTAASMPGQQARRQGSRILLRRGAQAAFANAFCVSLSIPGEVLLGPQGWAVSAAWAEPAGAVGVGRRRDRLVAAVQSERLSLPLAVRSRRHGDRLRPAGMGGQRKKLQDVLVDRKVGRHLRDSMPLVVDRDDRIVWVVAAAEVEDFRVTAPSQGVLLLNARRLGGLG